MSLGVWYDWSKRLVAIDSFFVRRLLPSWSNPKLLDSYYSSEQNTVENMDSMQRPSHIDNQEEEHDQLQMVQLECMRQWVATYLGGDDVVVVVYYRSPFFRSSQDSKELVLEGGDAEEEGPHPILFLLQSGFLLIAIACLEDP